MKLTRPGFSNWNLCSTTCLSIPMMALVLCDWATQTTTRRRLRPVTRNRCPIPTESLGAPRREMGGYVTEKIVNAFLAGCIPIYWGSRRYAVRVRTRRTGVAPSEALWSPRPDLASWERCGFLEHRSWITACFTWLLMDRSNGRSWQKKTQISDGCLSFFKNNFMRAEAEACRVLRAPSLSQR